ncbi:MAG TPA: hypothetical protein VJT73_12305, partial [Polyangiaceae bacterium]|nr:hypothetical protein [Polyangiaceae bacterium]
MISPAPELESPPGFIQRFYWAVDLRSLALLRIVLAVLLIADLLGRIGWVDAFYSNEGVLTNHFALFRPLSPHQFSLYFSLSSTRDVTFSFVMTLLVYGLFLVGYRTRLFHVLSFLCATSLHSRNLLIELPSDAPLHLFVGWALFLPLGARFSVDAVKRSLDREKEAGEGDLNRRSGFGAGPQGSRLGAPPGGAAGEPGEAGNHPMGSCTKSVAVLGLLVQVAVMHLAAALRQSGASWTDG